MENRNPKTAKISVVVPTYNAARTLEQCLHALRSQTDSNYEVIVVDDGSADNSAEICNESGFKTLRLISNKGQAIARNRGVREATGRIIAFVDSDAVVPYDWIEKYRTLLATHAGADMICSGYSESIEMSQPALFAFYEILFRRQNIPPHGWSSTSSNCII